jgi:hypothetical protein
MLQEYLVLTLVSLIAQITNIKTSQMQINVNYVIHLVFSVPDRQLMNALYVTQINFYKPINHVNHVAPNV